MKLFSLRGRTGSGTSQREFVVLMAMIQSQQALAIDAMLPALGVMGHDLGVATDNQRQLVIGVFLVCAGLGSLFPGALADRFGRRPVLFGSLILYSLLTLGCALAQDFTTMIVLRGLAGFSAAGLGVLPGAIIRDRMEGDRMASTQSLVAMIFMIVPMLAPTLGQGVLLVAGWRWIFAVMALGGMAVCLWAWLRLDETLDPANRQPIRMGAVLGNMQAILTTRGAAGYVLGYALISGALFGYINSSQQLIAEHFGAGTLYPMVFASVALAMSIASFTNSRIVERFGARRVSQTALLVYILAAGTQLALALRGGQTLWEFLPLLMINMLVVGFIGGNFGSIALQPFARMAGAAASVQGFLRTVIGALLGIVIGQAYDGSAVPVAAGMAGAGTITLLLVLYSERGRLFRRVLPPGAPRPDSGSV